jgi:CheY-like chemotaxis protein
MTHTTPPRHLVLYADDDPDDQEFVQTAFSANTLNVELVMVKDGVEALEYLNNLSVLDPNPCLIILDINTPRLNGKETLKKIKQMERFRNTPVVLFTTSSMPQDKSFALQHGAGFVTKPLDSTQMQMITNQFIEYCDEEIRKNIRKKII